MRNGHYELVVAPDIYPGKKYREKYVLEHHLVWWLYNGQLVPEGHVLHHKNGDKRDNRLKNLELKTNSEHSRDHRVRVPKVKLRCFQCGKGFEMTRSNHAFKTGRGQTRFHCSRSCGNRR